MKDNRISPQEIQGTGKDGRITREDVQAHVSSQHHSSPVSRTRDPSEFEACVPLTAIQSKMFQTMTRSLSIPHFSYADEIDVTDLSTLRQRLNANAPSEYKLSFLPFLVKALSLALHDFPLLNARIEMPRTDKDPPKLVHRKTHNIGIAMDSPAGLVIPVVKDVGSLSISNIAAEIRRLRPLAQANKLTIDDISGGTITVSNIGSIGGTYVSPIIASVEQVAILGLGKVRRIPAFTRDAAGTEKVEARDVCNLSWSADHRVVDGATVARCGERVKGYMEVVGTMIAALR